MGRVAMRARQWAKMGYFASPPCLVPGGIAPLTSLKYATAPNSCKRIRTGRTAFLYTRVLCAAALPTILSLLLLLGGSHLQASVQPLSHYWGSRQPTKTQKVLHNSLVCCHTHFGNHWCNLSNIMIPRGFFVEGHCLLGSINVSPVPCLHPI